MSTTAQSLDPNIEALLADVAGNMQDVADNAGNDWAPPCTGTKQNPAYYDIMAEPITRVNRYTAKDGKEYAVFNAPFTVIGGEFEGRQGSLPFFTGNPVTAQLIGTLAALLGYSGKDMPGRIRHILQNWGGKAYRMARYLGKAKPGQDPFQNTDFTEILSQ